MKNDPYRKIAFLCLLLALQGCTISSTPAILEISETQLAMLITDMSARDIVLLGESTHGTQEFYEIRSEISKQLIKDHGFMFIAVEGDWDLIYQLNLYIKGLSTHDNAISVLSGFDRWPRWMWANEVIADLAEWLKDHNLGRSPHEMVGIYGLDLYSAARSISAVDRIIGVLYQCLAPFAHDLQSYAQHIALGNAACDHETSQIYGQIQNKDFDMSLTGKEAFFLEQSAFVVKNAERHFRAMAIPAESSWNTRVIHMNHTLGRLRETKGMKAIVWAHNTHVGDARATPMADSGMYNLGQILREQGEDVFILGFSTYEGEVLAGREWGGAQEIMTIPPANADSYESVFYDLGMEKTFIMTNSPSLPETIPLTSKNRAIGVIYHPEREYPGNYVQTELKNRYDAFLFIRKTSALRPLQ